MKPETPILMITLQIPVQPDTSAEDVLEAIGQAVGEAIDDIKRKMGGRKRETVEEEEEVDPVDREELEAFRASVLKETMEAYSAQTKENVLASLGYDYKE